MSTANTILDGKYSEGVQLPAKAKFGGYCRQHLAALATPTIGSIECKQSPVLEFLHRYFHIPLLIITKHELGLPFPPRNLRIKFGANPFTICSYHSHRQTHEPTPVKHTPSLWR